MIKKKKIGHCFYKSSPCKAELPTHSKSVKPGQSLQLHKRPWGGGGGRGEVSWSALC